MVVLYTCLWMWHSDVGKYYLDQVSHWFLCRYEFMFTYFIYGNKYQLRAFQLIRIRPTMCKFWHDNTIKGKNCTKNCSCSFKWFSKCDSFLALVIVEHLCFQINVFKNIDGWLPMLLYIFCLRCIYKYKNCLIKCNLCCIRVPH